MSCSHSGSDVVTCHVVMLREGGRQEGGNQRKEAESRRHDRHIWVHQMSILYTRMCILFMLYVYCNYGTWLMGGMPVDTEYVSSMWVVCEYVSSMWERVVCEYTMHVSLEMHYVCMCILFMHHICMCILSYMYVYPIIYVCVLYSCSMQKYVKRGWRCM